MIEQKYSPSDLKEWYEAPRHFKALMNACVGYKLELNEKEAAEAAKKK